MANSEYLRKQPHWEWPGLLRGAGQEEQDGKVSWKSHKNGISSCNEPVPRLGQLPVEVHVASGSPGPEKVRPCVKNEI